jgi:hypothetical protein
MTHLVGAHETFEEKLDFHFSAPPGRKLSRPLGFDVDVVILDTSINDNGFYVDAKLDKKHLAVDEAFLRYLAALPSRPAILFVATPNEESPWPYHEHTLHLQLAQAHELSMVDMMEGDLAIGKALPTLFGANYTGEHSKQPTAWSATDVEMRGGRASSVAPLRDIFLGTGLGGFGINHYNAPFHEWVAAVTYYTLFEPLFGNTLASFPPVAPPTAEKKPQSGNQFLRCGSSARTAGYETILCHLANGVFTNQPTHPNPAVRPPLSLLLITIDHHLFPPPRLIRFTSS